MRRAHTSTRYVQSLRSPMSAPEMPAPPDPEDSAISGPRLHAAWQVRLPKRVPGLLQFYLRRAHNLCVELDVGLENCTEFFRPVAARLIAACDEVFAQLRL